MNVELIVDSTVDVPEHIRSRLTVVPLTIHFGQEEYLDGVTLDKHRFYERLVESDVLPTTSQPSLNAVVTALQGQERDTGLAPEKLQTLSDYWADVRLRYASFDHGMKAPSADVYRYEMPGGQYTNLKSQVTAVGLGAQFEAVREMYIVVNRMMGDIIKVTPSSKMVGDMAIFMVQNQLTPENILEKGDALTFPDSVVSYFKGMMGQPAGGFPQALQKLVLKGEEPITCRRWTLPRRAARSSASCRTRRIAR